MMTIEGKTLLGPLIELEEGVRSIIDWYGVDVVSTDLGSSLAEFCERYGIDLELLLFDLGAGAADE